MQGNVKEWEKLGFFGNRWQPLATLLACDGFRKGKLAHTPPGRGEDTRSRGGLMSARIIFEIPEGGLTEDVRWLFKKFFAKAISGQASEQ
jgi:hypothetical protein